MLYYGLILFMFFQYRYLRQNELIFLLAGAAETKQSLTSALWAYLADRPGGVLRYVMEAALLSAVFPGYWFWHHFHNFDRKVRRLVYLLEGGVPLAEALKAVRGVASKETVLAASVGQATGKLAETLRRVPRWSVATVWLDLMPRFFYPLFLLFTSFVIMAFLMTFIIPKFEKIFADFKITLPWETELFAVVLVCIATSRWFVKYWGLDIVFLAALIGLVILLIFNSRLSWYCPVVGRFYRMHVQSRVLKDARLYCWKLASPVPQALGVLLATGYFHGMVRQRLERFPWAAMSGGYGPGRSFCLHRQGFLPTSMAPLVRSAQRINHLPFALSELGDHRAKTMAALAHRFCMTFFPVSVMCVAVAIGFVAISLFMPLLALLAGVVR